MARRARRRLHARHFLLLAAGALLVAGPARASSYTITPGGSPVTVTTTAANENATVTFVGAAGQRVSLKIAAVTITSSAVSIKRPDGTNLAAPVTIGKSGGFIDTKTLPVTGTYTILVDPASTYTGSATLTLYDVPTDVTKPIVPGGAAVGVATAVPGQNARLTFTGTTGQRVAASLGSVTMSSAKVSLLNPDGTTLGAAASVGTAGGWLDTRTLQQNGTYTLLVDPQTTSTGSMTVTLLTVPPDVTGAITPGGAPVTVSVTAAGQNAVLSFAGTAGRRVSARLTAVTMAKANVTIRKPDGTTLSSVSSVGTAGGFIDVKSLPVTGTYSVLVDPQTTSTGSMTVTLYDVPADVTASTSPGGQPVTVTTTTPGQNAKVTFPGSAGEVVNLAMSGVTMATAATSGVKVSILKPDGTTLVAPVSFGTNGATIAGKALTVTGNYTILVDPQTWNTGSMTLALSDAAGDVSASIVAGGASTTVSITSSGQNARVTFSGTAGQVVSLRLSAVTIGTSATSGTSVSILAPDGTTFVAPVSVGTNGGFIDARTLPVTGTYTILVDPQGTSTGSITLTLYVVPSDAAASTSPGGAALTVTTSVPGQNARVSFAGTAGRRISLRMSNVAIGSGPYPVAQVSVLRPDGTALVAATGVTTAGAFIDATVLPATGTYTIVVDPVGANTGSMTLSLYDVPADATATLSAASPATLTLATPGQHGRVTFSGTAGDSLTLSFTGFDCCNTRVSILKPDGTTLVAPTAASPINAGLPVTGTYTAVVDPQSYFTGSVTLSMVVSTQPPTPPVVSFGESSPDTYAAGTTLYYRPTGAGGSFTVFASTGSSANISKVTFPGLSLGFSPTASADVTASPYTRIYTWTTGATLDSPSNTVTATDFAGRTGSSSFAIVRDASAPVTTDNTAVIGSGWKNTDQTVTLTATDSQSGVAATYSTTDGSTPTTASPTGQSLVLSPEGIYTISYFSVDRVGNAEAVKVSPTQIRIDKTPPSSVTLDPLPTIVRSGQVLSGSAADALSGIAAIRYYDCAGSSCTPATLIGSSSSGPGYAYTWSSEPADGTYRILARAVDNAGNTLDSATQTVTIDNTAPDTTITSKPSSASSSTTAAFSFTSTESGSTFQCQLDAGGWAACSSPSSSGGLTNGSHTFQVRAIDAAGNVDATPASATWTVDTVAPDTTLTSTPAATSNQSSAAFAFTATETGSTFQCQLDAGVWSACTSPKSLSGLADGSHTFQVRAIDAAGNIDATPATFTWTIDASPPDTQITSAPPALTAQTSASFSFTATEAGSTFQCQLDGGAWAACTSPRSLSGLADGSHTFQVRAIDPLGNVDPTPAAFTWTVDTAPPDTTITVKPANPTGSSGATFWFTATENGATFQCQLDGGAWAACTSPRTYTGLAEGAHSFGVAAIDAAGNVDPSPATYAWTVDLTPPTAPTIDSAPTGRISATSASFQFSDADPNATGFQCQLDAAAWAACTSPKAYTAIADGSHTFGVRAVDQAGNASAAATAPWTVDSTGPAVTVTAPAPGSATSNTTPTFAGAAGTANGDLPAVTVNVYTGTAPSGTPVQTLSAQAASGAWSAPAGASLADGTYTVQATQSDDLGNVGASAAVTFTVKTVPPPPPAITSAPQSPSAATSPTFAFTDIEPGDTFRCALDAAPAAACTSPRQLSAVGAGGHTFSVWAVDAAGNVSTATAYSWTVAVAAPSLLATPPTTSAATTAAFSFADAPYASFACKLDAGSFARCDSGSVSYAGPLTAGSHTFTVHALDADGVATSDQVYSWTVNTSAPTLTATPAGTTNATSATFSFSDAPYTSFQCKLDTGVFAACSGSVTYAGPLAAGSHTFTVHALDAAGVATADRTFTWTIDTTPPAVTLTACTLAGGAGSRTVSLSGAAGNASGDSATVVVTIYNGTGTGGSVFQTLNVTRAAAAWGPVSSNKLTSGATYTARATQADSAGNTGQSTTCTFTA
jgi:hypothetical protein